MTSSLAIKTSPDANGGVRKGAALPQTRMIDSIHDGKWRQFVSQHGSATVFHQSEWCEALTQTFGYQSRIHVIEDAGGEIKAAWPAMFVKSRLTGNRLVCMPFCHRAGPLTDSSEQIEALFSSLERDGKALGGESIEVRAWPPGVTVPKEMQRSDGYCTHFLDISDGHDVVMKGLNQNMRRSIRRAWKNGVTVRLARTNEDLMAFYRLYLDQRRRQRLLPQPEAFIRNIYEKLVVPGKGFIVIAEHEGRPISTLFAVGHNKTLMWTHSGATADARELLGTPATLWKSIEEACERGYTTFDFGRTACDDDGLLRFKEQWGATRHDLPYLYCGKASGVNTEEPSRLKKVVLDLYTRMAPDAIFTGLSRPLYRHLG